MVSRYSYLSYFMDENTPLYGGEKGVTVQPDRVISNGDSANTKRLHFHNHSGTHIDYPNHFFDKGLKSEDYAADTWIFEHPFLMHIPAEANEIISLTQYRLDSIPEDTDFLIIKTGFWAYRSEEKYWKNNPGLSPDLADQLRSRLKGLKVLGMDFISVTSYQNRELGREAHRSFLKAEDTILLVEDMDLSSVQDSPNQLMCFPLMIKGLDGSPVTIIGRF
jgi:arylformamidase